MGQSMPGAVMPAVWYTVAGSAFISISLQVLPLTPSTQRSIPGSDTTRHRLQSNVQRIVALTPNTQTMEQRNAARIMAKLESKLAVGTKVTAVDLSGVSIDGLMGLDDCNIFRSSNNLLP